MDCYNMPITDILCQQTIMTNHGHEWLHGCWWKIFYEKAITLSWRITDITGCSWKTFYLQTMKLSRRIMDISIISDCSWMFMEGIVFCQKTIKLSWRITNISDWSWMFLEDILLNNYETIMKNHGVTLLIGHGCSWKAFY